MSTEPEKLLSPGVLRLGWAGVLPFAAALALGAISQEARLAAATVFIAYGAVILSFLGGTRWTLALLDQDRIARFVEAVLPSLIGFAALLLSPLSHGLALLVLAAGFAAWFWLDWRDMRWSQAYRQMRLRITATVLVLHAAWLFL